MARGRWRGGVGEAPPWQAGALLTAPPPLRTPPSSPSKHTSAKQLRVQGTDKSDMGVTPREEAFAIAREEGLDLVLISPDASPPLARLIDFSKYKYEMERATKERQKASSKG